MTLDEILSRDQRLEKSGSDDGRTIAVDKDAPTATAPETLKDTLADPDPDADPAENIEDEG